MLGKEMRIRVEVSISLKLAKNTRYLFDVLVQAQICLTNTRGSEV